MDAAAATVAAADVLATVPDGTINEEAAVEESAPLTLPPLKAADCTTAVFE